MTSLPKSIRMESVLVQKQAFTQILLSWNNKAYFSFMLIIQYYGKVALIIIITLTLGPWYNKEEITWNIVDYRSKTLATHAHIWKGYVNYFGW